MLEDTGHYKDDYISIICGFTASNIDSYLAIVHKRIPRIRELPTTVGVHLFHQKVPPLDRQESRLLLQQLFRKEGVTSDPDAMDELAEHVDGYPPSAYFTASLAKDYGVSVLCADKGLLGDFKSRAFTRFVADLKLSDDEWLMLRYLASEQIMPLSVIASALDFPSEHTALVLRNLIDHSLVLVIDDKYGVSPPIRDVVLRTKGFLGERFYRLIRDRLTQAFWVDDEVPPTVETIDATLHAVARSGSADFGPYADLVRVSTIHRLATECYRRTEWEQAAEYAQRAERMDPHRMSAREVLFKSLVQLEQWTEAGEILLQFEKAGYLNASYLKGFMLRKQRRYPEALKAFELAAISGNRSYSLHRDNADCLYRCGRLDDALREIQWVLERNAQNIYVLDLIIKICIDLQSFKEAEKNLVQLERFDIERRFYHHRKATLLAAQGHWEAALNEAEKACSSGRAPFEAFATKTDVLIEMKRYKDALESLDTLGRRFSSHRSDVQLGLRCKMLISQGKWSEALAVYNELRDKTNPVQQGLLVRILELQGQDKRVPLADRERAKAEAAEFRARHAFSNVFDWNALEELEEPGEDS